MTIIALQNQSVFDIALQYYGTIEAVFDIAELNDLSITSNLQPGSVVKIPPIDYGYKEVANYYNNNKIEPATALGFNRRQQLLDYLLPQLFLIF